MFKNVKLSFKLIGGFGIVLLLLLVLMGIYHFSLTSTTADFNNLMQEEVAIANHASKVETLMLQCRRNEKDFLLRRDKKYLDRLEKNVASLKKESQSIQELARKSGNEEIAQKASAIIADSDNYLKKFRVLVKSWETRGLDHKSGLQGSFRNVAHSLAEKIKGHEVSDLYISLLQIRRYEKDYIRTESDKYKQKFLSSMDTYESVLEKSSCERRSRQAQQNALGKYRDAFNGYLAAAGSRSRQKEFYESMRSFAHEMEDAIRWVFVPNAGELVLDIRKNEKDYLLRGDEKYVKKTRKSIDRLLKAFKNAGILQEHVTEVKNKLSAYKEAFDSLVEEDKKITAFTASMRDAVHKIAPLTKDINVATSEAAVLETKAVSEQADSAKAIAVIVGCMAILVGVFLGFFITRSITKPITRIVEGLKNGADQTAAASNEVSSASQSLAQGASEQASSIEETSASLEEMASMAKQNADNAQQASTLAKQASESANTGSAVMDKLVVGMGKINNSSREVSKVAKAIEEIAFQTNLLALNAAVEAARAGEAGAGFAVVAEEVRNLAQRASEQAKTTSELIAESTELASQGASQAAEANNALGDIITGVQKVTELIAEITTASDEQAKGVEQVNTAVSEMDKVVQQNAANAEETSSSSEELSAQAESMNAMVGELNVLVTGSSGKTHHAAQISSGHKLYGSQTSGLGSSKVHSMQHREDKHTDKRALPAHLAFAQDVSEKKGVKPEEVIPFEDDKDLSEF